MLPVKKIAYNTIVQIIGKAANIFIGVLAVALLTRYLSPKGFGEYTTALSFLQIFGIFLDFGLYLVLLQEISKKDIDKNHAFSAIVTLRILSGLAFFVIVPLIVLFFPYQTELKIAIIMTSLAFFLNSLVQVYTAVFQKEMKMSRVALAESISKIVLLIAIMFFIYIKGNLVVILMANNISTLAFFLILVFQVKPYVKFKWTVDLNYFKYILSIAWPIGITTILNLIYFKADTLILSIYKPQQDVGFYGAAYKVLEVITALPHLILGLVLPIFTLYFVENKKKELNEVFQKVFDMFVVITFLIIITFSSEAKGVMNFIAGSKYGASIDLLRILIWPTTIIFFSSFFNYGIIAINRQREVIKYFLISSIFSLLAYFIFIPKYSYFGAAYVTFAVELMMALFSYFLLRKYTGWKINFSVFVRVLLVSIITYIAMQFMYINFLLVMLIGSLMYIALLVVFRVISKDFVKDFLNFKKS